MPTVGLGPRGGGGWGTGRVWTGEERASRLQSSGFPGAAVSQARPVARVADNHVCVPVRCLEALMGKSGLQVWFVRAL